MTPERDPPVDRLVGLPVDLAIEHVRVAIIGAGPAGLTAAAHLGDVGGQVRVLEREAEPGGIPRHSDHTGYGLRDLRRVMTGPRYARHLARDAERAGADVHTRTMVTGWSGADTLEVTSPTGRRLLRADAIVLATGARERPRTARLIPGDRPAGVYTTGELQNLVHPHHAPVHHAPVHHASVGRRAVVVGAELVSWSAVMTLREAGCDTVLMTSAHHRPESYAALTLLGRVALGVPVATRTRLVRINGRTRVESVEIEHLDTGRRKSVACDTVVTTGDWIPDNELVRAANLDFDPATRGPVVDTALRTSSPGVFAAGNLIHPVDTADVAALDGRHVAQQVRRRLADLAHLVDASGPTGSAVAVPSPGVRIVAEPPLRWVTPQVVRPHDPAPARQRYLLWTDHHVDRPRVEIVQDGAVVAVRRLPWPAAPGRVFRIPSDLFTDVRLDAGPVHVRLT
jgi:thioredoxin reductase